MSLREISKGRMWRENEGRERGERGEGNGREGGREGRERGKKSLFFSFFLSL